MSDLHRPERKRAVSVRLPEALWRKVRAAARKDDRSMSAWVERVVRAELAAREDVSRGT
jgi:predicted transcriptional regulator